MQKANFSFCKSKMAIAAFVGLLLFAARSDAQTGFYCTTHATQHLVFGGTGQECADAMP